MNRSLREGDGRHSDVMNATIDERLGDPVDGRNDDLRLNYHRVSIRLRIAKGLGEPPEIGDEVRATLRRSAEMTVLMRLATVSTQYIFIGGDSERKLGQWRRRCSFECSVWDR